MKSYLLWTGFFSKFALFPDIIETIKQNKTEQNNTGTILKFPTE
jgi:hypothetical protein